MRTHIVVVTLIASLSLSGASVVLLSTACSPADAPVWSEVEKTILNLLNSQAALSVIEAAVDAIDPALAGDVAATDAAIQAAITYLESIGAIPIPAMSYAESIRGQIAAKTAAKAH